MAKVKTKEELAKAVKNNEDEIIIEGDLKNKVIRIKAVGSVAWGVAAIALGVAITAILTSPGTMGISSALSLPAAAAAIPALGGVSVTTAAIGIAVAGGGIACLNKLREYKIVEKSDDRVVLKK